jgi:hypothetical protein
VIESILSAGGLAAKAGSAMAAVVIEIREFRRFGICQLQPQPAPEAEAPPTDASLLK